MATTPTAGYRPSNLSYTGARASPFRRPSNASPLSPSASTIRANTPTGSPLKGGPLSNGSSTPGSPTNHNSSPSKLRSAGPLSPNSNRHNGTGITSPPSASRTYQNTSSNHFDLGTPAVLHSDPLSRLPPALLQVLRDSFSALDRSNTGSISRADLVDSLAQLGLDASPSSIAAYFPPSTTADNGRISLAAYLNALAVPLGRLSRPDELTAAFAAFDEGDTGDIDLAELRDALLRTAPEVETQGVGGHGSVKDDVFSSRAGGVGGLARRMTESEIEGVLREFSGRKTFGKPSGRGERSGGGGGGFGGNGRSEVFKYMEFVNAVGGGAKKEDNGLQSAQ